MNNINNLQDSYNNSATSNSNIKKLNQYRIMGIISTILILPTLFIEKIFPNAVDFTNQSQIYIFAVLAFLFIVAAVLSTLGFIWYLGIIGDEYFFYSKNTEDKPLNTPSGAVWGLIIPFLNIVRPVFNLNEMLTGSSKAKFVPEVKNFYTLFLAQLIFGVTLSSLNLKFEYEIILSLIISALGLYTLYYLQFNIVKKIIEKHDSKTNQMLEIK